MRLEAAMQIINMEQYSIWTSVWPAKGTWWLRALSLLLLQSIIGPAVGFGYARAGCKLEECQHAHDGFMSLENQKWEFCQEINQYLSCLHRARRGCKGNINFHVIHKGLNTLFENRECQSILQGPPPPSSPRPIEFPGRPEDDFAPSSEAPPQEPLDCSYKGSQPEMRHCGLFGDPHLKTFEGHFQTCRVQGAWPLIDSRYLAVQVTNEPVRPGSYATVTTKITVIIKGGMSACTREKVYEAQAEYLPETFVDGSTSSGDSTQHSVQLRVIKHNEKMEIKVKHLAAHIYVHRLAGALSFSAQLPLDLALPEEGTSEGSMQLCALGCPIREQLRSSADVTQPVALTREAALQFCGGQNLSSTYLEWCVFDVMTTGDKYFVNAAVSAQQDVILLDPMAEAVLKESAKWTYSSAPVRFVPWQLVAASVILAAAAGRR
ncbi:repulsive guidance molecule B-like [Neocloeon triangulifer]|uniref:repulsive guidance molecule B-like n=1 Tax=Neocloeon triangulifer TaxID=2078957 RepID=UPI00286F58D2|nr:repulsive guidance molecule B-like [Neocloeon triangulifer]XP_059486310.1 repulsive guidance molecule B-like [Neocloeon triangulifer]